MNYWYMRVSYIHIQTYRLYNINLYDVYDNIIKYVLNFTFTISNSF